MKLRSIAFKWHIDAPVGDVLPILKQQLKLHLGKGNILSRSFGSHTLQISVRDSMCSTDRSYYLLRFFQENGPTDPTALGRILGDWYFAMSQHFTICVNWMHAEVDTAPFQAIYGFSESTPRIWSKAEKQLRFSFFPIQDYYIFDVKNEDIRSPIPHQRFNHWLEELKHNIKGQQKPDDQISLELVV